LLQFCQKKVRNQSYEVKHNGDLAGQQTTRRAFAGIGIGLVTYELNFSFTGRIVMQDLLDVIFCANFTVHLEFSNLQLGQHINSVGCHCLVAACTYYQRWIRSISKARAPDECMKHEQHPQLSPEFRRRPDMHGMGSSSYGLYVGLAGFASDIVYRIGDLNPLAIFLEVYDLGSCHLR
jgi:hypothetical protein